MRGLVLLAVLGAGCQDDSVGGNSPSCTSGNDPGVCDAGSCTGCGEEWVVNSAIWGSPTGELFMVGYRGSSTSGFVKRLVAGSWETLDDGAPPLWGIWGTGSSDFFVFGGQGAEVRRWTGGAWASWNLAGLWGDRADVTIRAVWGAASDDVYVVGRQGIVAHFDGTTWQAVDALTTADLEAIWGISGKDVRAVGGGGTILRFDGLSWTPEESLTEATLDGIWGSSASDIFVTGEITPELEHVILHNDGTGWVEQHEGPKTLLGIHGIAPDCVYAVGGIRDGDGARSGVFFFDGQRWTEKADSKTTFLWHVWVLPGCTFYAVGPDDTVIQGG